MKMVLIELVGFNKPQKPSCATFAKHQICNDMAKKSILTQALSVPLEKSSLIKSTEKIYFQISSDQNFRKR